MKKKIYKTILMATMMVAMVLGMSTVSYASEGWKLNDIGWWYSANEAETAWCASGWYYIDGNGDNVAECYLFDSNGYMYADCITPDGYTVNAEGQWTVDGVVQTIPYSGVISYDAYKNGNGSAETTFYGKNGKVENVSNGVSGSTNTQDTADNTEDDSVVSSEIDRSIEGTYYTVSIVSVSPIEFVSNYTPDNTSCAVIKVIDENTISCQNGPTEAYSIDIYVKNEDGNYEYLDVLYGHHYTISFSDDGTMIRDDIQPTEGLHKVATLSKDFHN